MENLKIRVTTGQESKEVQELFFELGWQWKDSGKVILEYDPNMPFFYLDGEILHKGASIENYQVCDRKEITLQELRDMVVLNRVSINDKIATAEVARQKTASQWDLQVGGDHYKTMKIQPAKFALENNLDYCQANAIKYICRHESKNGKQDLEKAKHYIDLLIEHYYGGDELF